jgi:transposase
VNATTRKLIARTTRAIRRAVQVCRAARYASLNGPLQQQLAEGTLIQASTYLRTLGVEDAGVASFRSWYGRKVKAAYRAAHSNLDPQRAWVMIDGRWTSVHVYNPSDPALAAGVTAYPRLAECIAAIHQLAA